MRDAWPAFSRVYGIRPWELDLLTIGEIEAYGADLRALIEQQKQ